MSRNTLIFKISSIAAILTASVIGCDRANVTDASSLFGGEGSIVDNGGDIIHCRSQAGSAFSGDYNLDYVMTHNPAAPDEPEEDTWPELRARTIRLISEKSPQMAASLVAYLDRLESSDQTQIRVWHGSTMGLSDLQDEGLLNQIAENCKTIRNGKTVPDLMQMVRRRYLEDSGVNKVFYYYDHAKFQDLKNRLPLQFSYLVIHEWLWDYADSPWANRSVNHLIHSKSSEAMSPGQFQTAMRSYGIEGDEGNFVGKQSGTTDLLRQKFSLSPACDFERRLIIEFAPDTGRVILDGSDVSLEATVEDPQQRLGGLICGIALVAGAGSTSGAPASIIISIKLGAASFDKTSSGNISLTGICREEECFNKDGELGSMVFKNNFLGHRWLLNLRSDVPAYVVTPRLVLIGARQ